MKDSHGPQINLTSHISILINNIAERIATVVTKRDAVTR